MPRVGQSLIGNLPQDADSLSKIARVLTVHILLDHPNIKVKSITVEIEYDDGKNNPQHN